MKIKNLLGLLLIFFGIVSAFAIPLSPLLSDRRINFPFLEESKVSNSIIYFGFTGCSVSCPITLGKLADYIDNSEYKFDSLGIFFIDLNPTATLSDSQAYASYFHPNIRAVVPSSDQLSDMQSQFALNYSVDEKTGIISHKGRVYLLQKTDDNWRIKSTLNENRVSLESLDNLFSGKDFSVIEEMYTVFRLLKTES